MAQPDTHWLSLVGGVVLCLIKSTVLCSFVSKAHAAIEIRLATRDAYLYSAFHSQSTVKALESVFELNKASNTCQSDHGCVTNVNFFYIASGEPRKHFLVRRASIFIIHQLSHWKANRQSIQ